MAKNKGVEQSIRKLVQELNELVQHLNLVHTVQLVLPQSPEKLQEVQRYTLSCDKNAYLSTVDSFVLDSNGSLVRSLLYLDFNEQFKYGKLQQAEDTLPDALMNDGYSFSSEPVLVDSSSREYLSNLSLEKTWNTWVQTFASKRVGKSTFWTYIKIDLEQDDFNESSTRFGAFLTLNVPLDPVKDLDLLNRLNRRTQDYLTTLTVSVFTKEIKDKTTLAQVAEVVNRNYAHHIGSHVSRRASFEKILARLQLSLDGLTKEQLISIAAMRSRLEKYKDERSEFIASVTNSPSVQTSGLYQDVIRPFIENTLLIDNIGKNEGICYHFQNKSQPKNRIEQAGTSTCQLVVRVFINKELIDSTLKNEVPLTRSELTDVPEGYLEQCIVYQDGNGDQKFTSLSLPYYLEQRSPKEQFYENHSIAFPDLNIGLPGGLGKHALYSFLENYIRNTAKHSFVQERDGQNPVEIILKIDPEHLKSDGYTLTVTDNISKAEHVEMLNEKLGKDIYDKSGGMGIADMKICACLLSGKKLNDENLTDCLRIVTDNGHLAYQLKLLKPKEIALIGCQKERTDESRGIFYFDTLQSFISGESNSHSFNFCLISDSQLLEITSADIKHLLPRKTMIIGDSINEMDVFFNTPQLNESSIPGGEHLVEWCWEQWFKTKYPTTTSHLGVYFEQNELETPTKEWLNTVKNHDHSGPVSIDVHYHDINHEISPPVNPLNKGVDIYLDRHARLINNIRSQETDFIGANFWSLIDKNNPDFDLLISTDVTKSSSSLFYELVEMARMNILVVDERVTEAAHQNYLGDEKLRNLVTRGGFRKFHTNTSACQVIDACWASNVHIATHFNGNPVSNNLLCDEEKSKKHHFCKIDLKPIGNRLEIETTTNHYGRVATYKKIKPLVYGWHDSSEEPIETYSMRDAYQKINIRYDALIIHRTILKKLMEEQPEMKILQSLDVQKIYVITGGGAIDFLPEDYRISILPSNILYDYILSKRPAKFSLCRKLK